MRAQAVHPSAILAAVGRLTVQNHDRDRAGMTYVYPVVSRRARGVSIGVNLNPNNACNWRCVYCQVPDLVRGKAPEIDVGQLEAELSEMLRAVVEGDWMQDNVDPALQRLNDIALSGNGEPTTAQALGEVLAVIERLLQRFDLLGRIKLVMISNGSMIDQERVQDCLRKMATLNGELWFKFDRATEAGLSATNSVRMRPEDHARRLRAAADLVPTFVQTCMFARDGAPPPQEEVEAYLGMLRSMLDGAVPLKGVLLYGLARTSYQPEAKTLARVDEAWLERLGARIEGLGLPCRVTP